MKNAGVPVMPACMPSRRSFSISVRYLPVVRQESHCLSSSFKLRAYSSRASRSSLDALKSVNWQCHLVVANPHYTRDRLAGVGVEEVTVISNQSSGRNSARVSVPHCFPSALRSDFIVDVQRVQDARERHFAGGRHH